MRENLIKTILGFYDQNGEFQKNDRYSDRYQSVYTKSDDNSLNGVSSYKLPISSNVLPTKDNWRIYEPAR